MIVADIFKIIQIEKTFTSETTNNLTLNDVIKEIPHGITSSPPCAFKKKFTSYSCDIPLRMDAPISYSTEYHQFVNCNFNLKDERSKILHDFIRSTRLGYIYFYCDSIIARRYGINPDNDDFIAEVRNGRNDIRGALIKAGFFNNRLNLCEGYTVFNQGVGFQHDNINTIIKFHQLELSNHMSNLELDIAMGPNDPYINLYTFNFKLIIQVIEDI